MKKITEKIWNLIYPGRCVLCDAVLAGKEKDVCRLCGPKLQIITQPYCMKCGKALNKQEDEYCNDCLLHPHMYEQGRSLLVYDGIIKKSLYRFKYAGRKEYAKAYSHLAEQYLGDYINEIQPDALIPVPLHKKRYQKRGYNQSEVFARELGAGMGIPVVSKMVERVKNTLPQKELDRSDRQNNLKKAFKINRNDVKLNTIIIIDDIYTTGSTIDALAATLKEAGVQKIFFLTISGGR